MEITSTMVITVVTAIITYIFGILAKKFNWIDKQYIPAQNAVIGVLAGILCYLLGLSGTDVMSSIIYCLVGSMASGGTYDMIKTKKGE